MNVWKTAGFESDHTAEMFDAAHFRKPEEAFDVYEGLNGIYSDGKDDVFGKKLDFRSSNDNDTKVILEKCVELLDYDIDPAGVVMLVSESIDKHELEKWEKAGFKRDNASIEMIVQWKIEGFGPDDARKYTDEYEKSDRREDYNDAIEYALEARTSEKGE